MDKNVWISVEKQLPELSKNSRYFSDYVKCRVGNKIIYGCVRLYDKSWSSRASGKTFYPTHWQPLPSPPKQQQHG